MDNNRLNAKDLINVGIYTAICLSLFLQNQENDRTYSSKMTL